MPNIRKQYIDPMTGAYSPEPPSEHHMAFITIHFSYDEYPGIVLEHSLDDDIKSLVMNLMVPGVDRGELDALNNALFGYLNSLLPEPVNVGVETSDDGLCISIPDFSACPLLQSETLASSVLARALAVLDKLEIKKGPR